MDVGLLGVIAAFAIGIGGIGVSIWSTKHTANQAIVQRQADRRTDAYIEILRLSELRGQALLDRYFNFANKLNIDTGLSTELEYTMPPRGHFGEAAALLAAFASKEVHRMHDLWEQAVYTLEEEFDLILVELEESGGVLDPDTDRAQKAIQFEQKTRNALAAQIRKELATPAE